MGHRAAIVLAAGASSRYGENKLLVPIDGIPLVRRTVELVCRAAVAEVIVVLGFEEARVRRALAELPVRFANNPEYARGMSGSVAVGAAALPEECEAAVIVLADQPVEPSLIDALLALQRSSAKPIAAPYFNGERRHPVAFGADLFAQLRQLTGHAGARVLVDADATRVARLDLDRPAPPDLDVPEDREPLSISLRERGLD